MNIKSLISVVGGGKFLSAKSLLIAIVASACTLPASAFKFGDAEYSVLSSQQMTAQLTKWSGASGDITIPGEVTDNGKTYKVTKIAMTVFAKNTAITSVTSENIVEIDGSAFSGCTSLKSAKLGNTLKKIGNYAFYQCSNLEFVNLPEGLETIGNDGFNECSNLFSGTAATLTIPKTVSSIGKNAFASTGIRVVNIATGSMLKSIPAGAFVNCMNLVNISISSGITEIGQGAFVGCVKLGERTNSGKPTTIVIPSTITKIGDSAFSGCTSLSSVILNEGLQTISGSAFNGCTDLSGIAFPASLTTLESSAFGECSSLASVKFKEGIKVIGSSAFFKCTALEHIDFPASLVKICSYGFFGCSRLKLTTCAPGQKIDVSEPHIYDDCHLLLKHEYRDASHATLSGKKLVSKSVGIEVNFGVVGDYCYKNCKSLIAPPDGITSYGKSAFYGCESLTVLPDCGNMTSIPDQSFSGCKGLTEIVIPSNISEIGKEAFNDCKNAVALILNNGLKTIGERAFGDCGFETLTLPGSLRHIGEKAFYYVKLKGTLMIPDLVASIGVSAFEHGAFESIVFGSPSMLTVEQVDVILSIGSRAFCWNSGIEAVTTYHVIPPHLSDDAFEGRVYETAVLTVPAGTAAAYREAEGWKLFKNIVEMGSSGVTDPEADAAVEITVGADGSIAVSGVAEDVTVAVYGIDGSVAYRGMGAVTVDALPSGCYVVSVGSVSRKVRI